MTSPAVSCRLCGGTLTPTGHACGDRPELKVFACSACGAVQLADIAHAIDGHYAADDYFPADWAVNYAREAHWNEKRIERCLALLPDAAGRRILDVGCGIGGFLRRATPHFARVVGFDLSQAVTRRLREDGLEAVSDYAEVPDDIDTLVLFHVLEHVPEPWSLLADLLRRFPKVDQVVVETPNTAELLVAWFDLPAYRANHYSADHIWYYTNQTLARVLEKAGLEVVHSGQLQRYQLGNGFGWLANGRGGGQAVWPTFNDKTFHDSYETALERAGAADSVFLIGARR